MEKYNREANLIITHGGPASFLAPLSHGKIPIVVPRQVKYEEHVNNHQVDFTKEVEKRMGIIIPIYDIKDLKKEIVNYDRKNKKNKSISNNDKFCNELNNIIEEMVGG